MQDIPDYIYVAGLIVCAAAAVVLLWKLIAALWRYLRYRSGRFRVIDRMSGEEFEDFVAVQYEKLGYTVEKTPASHDYGADLLLYADGTNTAVQVKRYDHTVGVSAVQQVFTAKYYYDMDEAVVITNSYFTQPARILAQKVNVELIDREKMAEIFEIR